MGRRGMMFGKSEDLNCLEGTERFDLPTQDGAVDVCYSAKVTTDSFILPWRIYVSDYVFATDDDTYYQANDNQIEYLQTTNVLPNPLPEYRIGRADLFFGNLAWVVLVACLIKLGIDYFRENKTNSD